MCEIELDLECQARPAFSLAIGDLSQLKRRSGELELETWADELVVRTQSQAGDFYRLLTLPKDARTLQLRTLWDRPGGRLVVYHGEELLIEKQIDPARPIDGVLLESKGNDLTVKRLRIGAWNGRPRLASADGQQRIHTFDGEEFVGRISGLDADGFVVVDSVQGEPQRVDLNQIAELVVGGTALDAAAGGECLFRFYDGTRLHGQLISIAGP